MRLSRHAKNKLRALRMTPLDAEWVVSHGDVLDRDAEGRPRYLAEVRGVPILVVVALDEPDMIVTVYRRGRG